MAVVVLLLNGKEQEHKLEHGTNQIVDISELKIEHKLEPELQKETVVSTYLWLCWLSKRIRNSLESVNLNLC